MIGFAKRRTCETPGRLLPRATKAQLEGHKAAPNLALQSLPHSKRGERMRRIDMVGCVGGRSSVDAGICSGAIDDNGASTVARTTSDMSERLTSAAKFVTALHVATRKGRSFWRTASMIGKSAGIEDPIRLERAVQDAATAGLLERRASQGLVKLTAEGRGLGA